MKVRSSQMEQAPVATHFARIVGVVNLGHMPAFEYGAGKVAPAKWKIELTYEFVDTGMAADGRPFHVSEEITNTDNKKGTLFARAGALGHSCGNCGPDWLGTPCMVSYGPGQTGKNKITGVSGVPMGSPVSDLKNPSYFFDMEADEPDMATWDTFSNFRKGKMRKALNLEETVLYQKLVETNDLGEEEKSEY